MASDVQRELIVEQAVRRANLDLLAESAAQPGFVRAAARFVTELGEARVDPARFTQALRAWAGHGPRARYAEEVAAILRGYREGLETAGLADPELFAWRALERAAARTGALGRHAGLRVRLRRLQPAPARRARDDRRGAPVRRGRLDLAALRARPSRVHGGGQRPPGPALPGRSREAAPSARRPLRARGARAAAPHRTPPLRGRRGARARRRRRRRLLPPGRRPAVRDRAGRCAPARAAARRRGAGGHRRRPTPPRRVRLPPRAGLRRLRDPLLAGSASAARTHRLGPRPARPRSLRGVARRGDRRGPARMAADARAARAARPGRPARVQGQARRRALRRAGPRDLGGRALGARRARPPAWRPLGSARLPRRAGAPADAPVQRPVRAARPGAARTRAG